MSPQSELALIGGVLAIAQGWMAFWIRKLEKNTNSIKDALVKSTAEKSFAEGVKQGQADKV